MTNGEFLKKFKYCFKALVRKAVRRCAAAAGRLRSLSREDAAGLAKKLAGRCATAVRVLIIRLNRFAGNAAEISASFDLRGRFADALTMLRRLKGLSRGQCRVLALRALKGAGRGIGVAAAETVRDIALAAKTAFIRTVRFSREHDHATVAFGVMLAAAVFTYNMFTGYEVGVRVYHDGELVAKVDEQRTFDASLGELEREISDDLGQPYSLGLTFDYRLALIDRDENNTADEIKAAMNKYVKDVALMSVLYVDGVEVGANEDGEAIDAMLERIKQSHAMGVEGETLGFYNDVEIDRRLCFVSDSRPIEQMEKELSEPSKGEGVYTIKKGDTLWAIAPRYGMSVGDIVELNGLDSPTSLLVGDEIVVSKAEYRLSVVSTFVEDYVRDVPYETQYIDDDTMYKNQKKVKVSGVNGSEAVTAEVMLQDGVEIERRILSAELVSAPVTQVVYVGTKTPPPTAPTGTFMRPTNGTITSRYGYRGREFHTGVDIANSYGTTIAAADGGTVTLAGWHGGYGYCVIIDHGNGYTTLYGHNSKLCVSVGDKVAKGQKIAEMGSTGRSTGNHCHFEVRINGQHQNPLNYV